MLGVRKKVRDEIGKIVKKKIREMGKWNLNPKSKPKIMTVITSH